MLEIEDPFVRIGGRLDQHCAGSVSKQNARRAILVIEDRRHGVAADDHHFFVRARADKLRAHRERVRKSRACRGKVEAPRALRANAALHQARRCREKHVRRYARQNNEINFLGIGFGLRE